MSRRCSGSSCRCGVWPFISLHSGPVTNVPFIYTLIITLTVLLRILTTLRCLALSTLPHLSPVCRVNVAVCDGQAMLHYPRPLLARQLRFEANVTLRFLRQFVAASRRDAKNVDRSVVLKLKSRTQSVHIIYLIRLLKFLLFSVHPHWTAERATVSENLNPRVGSMIVLSLLSSVLLLEEAAAEKGPGTFFSKGKLRVDVGGMGIKAGPLKLAAGLVTTKNIHLFDLYEIKTLPPKQRAWKGVYSRGDVPVIIWDNGTYHSIVEAREKRSMQPPLRSWEARGWRARSQYWPVYLKPSWCAVQSITGRDVDFMIQNLTVHRNHIITQLIDLPWNDFIISYWL